jgi:RNA polymerase sigma factor (sigma-70 family)
MTEAPGVLNRDLNRQWADEVALSMGDDLLRFLRSRLAHTHEAEDLAQEVYLRLLRVKDNERISNPRAYVLRVAANVLFEWRLLACNRLAHSADPLDQLLDGKDILHEAEIQQQVRELQAALAVLTPKCRAVLLMHRRDRYTYEEISVKMGISVSMVKKYLVRGLTVCQQRVSRGTFAGRPSSPGVKQHG